MRVQLCALSTGQPIREIDPALARDARDFMRKPSMINGTFAYWSRQTLYDVKITDTYKGEAIATMKDSRGNEIGHSAADRTTFVVAPDGKIVATIGGVAGDANAEQALTVVQQLAAKHAARN
jgi:peroxiredoxin Q/BCP